MAKNVIDKTVFGQAQPPLQPVEPSLAHCVVVGSATGEQRVEVPCWHCSCLLSGTLEDRFAETDILVCVEIGGGFLFPPASPELMVGAVSVASHGCIVCKEDAAVPARQKLAQPKKTLCCGKVLFSLSGLYLL